MDDSEEGGGGELHGNDHQPIYGLTKLNDSSHHHLSSPPLSGAVGLSDAKTPTTSTTGTDTNNGVEDVTSIMSLTSRHSGVYGTGSSRILSSGLYAIVPRGLHTGGYYSAKSAYYE